MVNGSYSVSDTRFLNSETHPAPRILGGLWTRRGILYNVKAQQACACPHLHRGACVCTPGKPFCPGMESPAAV